MIPPPLPEFPEITIDTSAEELLRILTGRLHSLETRVHHQNQVIESLKQNSELEKEKLILL
jgi:hypothetical protein